jgi:hypothetical protein
MTTAVDCELFTQAINGSLKVENAAGVMGDARKNQSLIKD